LLSALELKAGMKVADVGAGTVTTPGAWRSDGRGRTVYAVDIQPEMIKLLEDRCRGGAAT